MIEIKQKNAKCIEKVQASAVIARSKLWISVKKCFMLKLIYVVPQYIFLTKIFILLGTIHDLCQLLGGGKGHPKIAMKVDFIYIN